MFLVTSGVSLNFLRVSSKRAQNDPLADRIKLPVGKSNPGKSKEDNSEVRLFLTRI